MRMVDTKTVIETRLTITIPQMANLLGISRSSAYRIAGQRGFPLITIGKRKMVNVKFLQKWIDDKSGKGVW